MATQENMRCARCCIVALDVFSNIVQELLQDSTTPTIVYNKITKAKNLMDNLDLSQKQIIKTLQTNGFRKLDFSLIYKIVKYFKLYISPPTRNWKANPQSNETGIGDDVERMRRARNRLFHKTCAEVSEEEFEDFFNLFIEVGQRVDIYLNKPTDNGYEVCIRNYKECHLDTDVYEKYLEERQEKERLEELAEVTAREKVVHVFIGKSFREIIEEVKSLTDDRSTPIKLIIHGIEDSKEQAEILTQLAKEGRISSENITFKSATNECIALYLDIRNKILQNEDVFLKEITGFILQVLTISSIKYIDNEECNVIITSDEDDSHIDYLESEKPSDESVNTWQIGNTLLLNLDVKNKVFETEETLKENLDEFVSKLLSHTNGNELIKDKEVIAVLTPDDDALDVEERKQSVTEITDKSSKGPIKITNDVESTEDMIDDENERVQDATKLFIKENQKENMKRKWDVAFKQENKVDNREISLRSRVAATKKQLNYLEIHNLLEGEATDATRIVFDREFNPDVLQRTIGQKRLQLERLRDKRIINRKRWDLLYPKTGKPSSDTFDLTLMLCLLRNFTPMYIREELSDQTDLSAEADLSRLKSYRNMLKLSYEKELSNNECTRLRKDITGIIERLAGREFIETYVDTDIPPSYGPIPTAIKYLQRKSITEWKEADYTVVITKAIKHLQKLVRQENIVIVTGTFGSGKSTAANHIALELLQSQNYEIVSAKFPDDVLRYFKPDSKQIFVFDDVCGKYTIDICRLNSWKLLSKDIQYILEGRCCKILLTTRLNIFQNEEFSKSMSFCTSAINLGSEEFMLSIEEKNDMAFSYSIAEEVYAFQQNACFPLLCKTFSMNRLLRTDACYQKIIKDELFSQMNESDQTSFATLFLFAVFNNFLPGSMLEIGSPLRSTLEKVSDVFKMYAPFTLSTVKTQLAVLDRSYLKKVDSGYTMIDDTVFDCFIACCGEHMFGALVALCHTNLIHEQFQFESIKDDTHWSIIKVPETKETKYFDRVLLDIKNGNIIQVFENRQLRFKSYRQKFIAYIEGCPEFSFSTKAISDALSVVSLKRYDDIQNFLQNLNKK